MATPACDCIKYGSPLAESNLMKYAINGVVDCLVASLESVCNQC